MNNYIITRASDTNELCHHGVKGMKWGHRKYYRLLVFETKLIPLKLPIKMQRKHIINLSMMLINIVRQHIVLAKSDVKPMMPDGRKHWQTQTNSIPQKQIIKKRN